MSSYAGQKIAAVPQNKAIQSYNMIMDKQMKIIIAPPPMTEYDDDEEDVLAGEDDCDEGNL